MSNIRALGLELGIKSSKLENRKRDKRQSKCDQNFSRSEPYKRTTKLKVNQINLSDFTE